MIGTYNLVSKVVPNIGLPNSAPLGLTGNCPSQCVVRTWLTRSSTALQLSEVTLEESDLMFSVQAWCVGILARDREVVEELSGNDCGSRGLLWNQLGSSHVLPIPVCSVVEGDLDTLVGSGVRRVLVVWGEVYV